MSPEFTESFSVFNEPITRKLGYINFGFVLDTQPARSPVLVLFIVNYLVCTRSRVTNMTRSFEHREADEFHWLRDVLPVVGHKHVGVNH